MLANTLQWLSSLYADKQSQSKGYMHVKAFINGKETMAMLEKRVNHKFFVEIEVSKLVLKITQQSSKVKV